MKYYYLEESPCYPTKYIIRLNSETLPFPNGINGSYNILAARLLNLDYAEYLRYARDKLGAVITGKNKKYPVAYFPFTKEVEQFVKLLNSRLEIALKVKESK